MHFRTCLCISVVFRFKLCDIFDGSTRAIELVMMKDEVRLARGKAKGMLAAAKSEMLAAEVEFKIWQSMLASERAERRVYGT